MISANQRRPWTNYAAGLWAILFATPHVWWALGIPVGFPGGAANHQLMVSTWRFFFDVVVILLSITAVFVALALVRPWGQAITHRILRIMAWIASAMLTLRGVAGLVVDGTSDPVWWPTFLLGGILFGRVAWLARSPNPATNPAPTT